MRQISVNRLQQGDVLGRTIFSYSGRVLLGKGVMLTWPYISRLKELGISIVYVDDDETKDIVVEDVISEETRREAMKTLAHFAEAVRMGEDPSGFQVMKAVTNIIGDILFQEDIFVSLTDMRSYDNQVYTHSVSVCVLSIIIGKAMGLDRETLEALAVGALLHDIGTVRLPQELIAKREVFTSQEMELYQTHTIHGYEILRNKPDLNILSAHIALQHHEWLNGSGYPRKLSGNRLHVLAQIVGLADFYDNLVNDGPGHSRIVPHEACEIVMGCANKLYSQPLVVTFLKHIAVYPTGCTVKLSTGEVGIVVDQNKSLPMRPIIRVLMSDQEMAHVQAKEYNLVEDLTTFIVSMVE